MPTYEGFQDGAQGLREVIADLDELSRPLETAMGADVMEGGDLTDSVYESIKVTRITAQSLGAVIQEYVTEATRRMEEARAAIEAQAAHEDELALWRRRNNMRERHADRRDTGFDERKRLRESARSMGFDIDSPPEPRPTPPPPPADYIDI